MSAPTPRASALRSPLALLLFIVVACADRSPPLDPEATHPLAAAGGPHVVHVAPPQGNPTDDRASIIAALEEVRPGGTVQFAPGTYVIGVVEPLSRDPIRVTIPHITLLGHPDGTILRGCDLAAIIASNCFGLELSGGHQTVRNLSFEYLAVGVILGRWAFPVPIETRVGGYRIENNEFRNSNFGVRMFGQWTQPAIVRSNTFLNTAQPVQAYGRTVHVIDNEMSAPDFEQIPLWFHTLDGIGFYSSDDLQSGPCDHNVAARNRIQDYWSGVTIASFSIRGCRHNVIRDNLIANTVEFDPFPGAAIWMEDGTEGQDLLAHTLIQGNRISGAQGTGVFAYYAANTRVVGNIIANVSFSQFVPEWFGEGNGSGVWLSPESRENQILNNRFSNIEAEEVILEGDYNHVATRSASDVVRDLGVGNRVTGPGTVVTTAAPFGARARVASATVDGVGAPGMLRERLGVRGRMLEEGRREAAPR